MAFRPFEVNVPHLAYTILGAFVVIFGMFSLVIKEKGYIGEAPIATIVGIIAGPYVTGLFDPGKWGGPSQEVTDEITLEVTRVIIAISVFAVGVELPKAYMKKHWRTLVFLLGPCMLWGWMISGLLMWALFPHLEFLSCLVIAAAVTPTDPILAQAVIGGKFADKHVPAHVRHMLSAESGSNDGAAFPFLGIALYLTLDRSPGHAVGHWFYYTIAYEVILGIILGALLGWVARKVMKFSEAKRLIDRQSYVAQYISLAVLSIGLTSLLGSDDLLSAFACGCAFAWDGFFNSATEDAVFSNVIDLLFNCAAFIYIGAVIPFTSWNDSAIYIDWWRLLVFAILILLLRRLPVILALYRWIPDIKTFREALFVGWFGPMGVGAVFIATLAKISIPEGEAEKDTAQVDLLRESIQPIVFFLVLSSIVTHGLSIPFFSLGRRVHSITYTWSRNPSMDTRRDNEPAWTTHARRINPGEEIVINRDEDGEDGDLGIRQREKSSGSDSLRGEKLEDGEDASGGSSSSRTAGAENIEMVERRLRHDRGSHEGEHADEHTGERAGRHAAGESGSEEIEEDAGDRTPPLAEYREGNHLVIERKGREGEEVEVEVIRNAFAHHKKPEKSTFFHPRPLKNKEVDRLTTHLPKSLEHATSLVRDEGKEAIDALGLGLMISHSRSSERSGPTSCSASPQQSVRTASPEEMQPGEGLEVHVTAQQPEGSSGSTKPPRIRVELEKKKVGLRQRFFGRHDNSHDSKDAEEGRAPPSSSLLAPSYSSTRSRPVPIPSPSGDDDDTGRGLSLTRTLSIPRTTSIRFAADSSQSSGTAPNRRDYGNSATGFKRNPNLAMYRSSSVQSSGSTKDSPSVSFKEPDRRR